MLNLLSPYHLELIHITILSHAKIFLKKESITDKVKTLFLSLSLC
jgi:hypothetical protein